MPQHNWLEALIFSGLASFAGLMGYLMRNVNDRRVITWERTLLETFASGFIGFMSMLICKAMNLSYEWTGVIVGVLGWLGATVSMQLFERIVRKKLGIDNVDLGDIKTEIGQTTAQHNADSAVSGSASVEHVAHRDTAKHD
jgi:hypothetical protein